MSINWSAINNHSLIGRLLRLPLRALPKRMVLRIRRGPAKGMRWIVGSSNHGCWLGTYELEKQRSLDRFIQADMVVYDIGAHSGFYTLFFAQRAKFVYAFEPFAENVRYLVAHVQMNSLRNVQILQVAVAGGSGLTSFTINRNRSENTLTEAEGSILLVPTLSLDEAIKYHGLQPPDLVKMDVEGSEALVLQGARKLIEHYHPIWFIALHGEEQNRLCQQVLRDAGYRLYDLHGNALGGHWETDEIYALPEERIEI